jgi:hypothetical protein
MNWSAGGEFSKSLLGLQLQLQTLLEGVGGDATSGLLDSLAQLSETERRLLVPILTSVVRRVAAETPRTLSDEERSLKEFENSLYDSVLGAIGGQVRNATTQDPDGRKRLAVVDGGKPTDARSAAMRSPFKKPVRIPSTIDLAKARESRRPRGQSGSSSE